MPWYRGPTLLEHLQTVEVGGGGEPAVPFSGPMGQPSECASSAVSRARSFPARSRRATRCWSPAPAARAGSRRSSPSTARSTAASRGDAITLTLDRRDRHRPRRSPADPRDPPEFVDQFAAHVIWMSERPARSRPFLPVEDRHTNGAGHRHRAQAPDRCRDPGAFGGPDLGPERDRVLQPVDRRRRWRSIPIRSTATPAPSS